MGLTVIAYPLRELLPPLIDEDGIRTLLQDTAGTGRLDGITPLAIGAVVVTVLVMMAAAILFRFSYVERGTPSDGFLAVGLVIMAFAELQSAFYPSVYTGLVTTADIMRLVAYGVLLLGIGTEQRADLRALRPAYTALDRLRVTEAERAALEERSRLAREIHDGLAQHLWFAKLKFERLATHRARGGRAARGRGGPGARRRHRRGAPGARDDAHQPRRRTCRWPTCSPGPSTTSVSAPACVSPSRRGRVCRPPCRRDSRSSCCASSRRRSRTSASTPTRPWSASAPTSGGRDMTVASRTTAGASTRPRPATGASGSRAWRSGRACWAAACIVTSEPSGWHDHRGHGAAAGARLAADRGARATGGHPEGRTSRAAGNGQPDASPPSRCETGRRAARPTPRLEPLLVTDSSRSRHHRRLGADVAGDARR